MDFRILGPLEIGQDGRAVPCKGAKQRLLLATLLLQPNRAVSSDSLIEALWGECPPATAPKALQVHVSQLRRMLEADVLVTRAHGYELRVGAGELDLHAFEDQTAEARAAAAAGQAERASTLLTNALALWRGPPLADLTFEDVLQPEIARLDELHLTAIEDRVDADLDLGRHVELIAELERLAARHPLRERIRGQLMLALYRSGRQADALEVYADTRAHLVDELGLEPSRELKQLQQRVLEQDVALEPRARRAPAVRASDGLAGRESEFTASVRPIDAAVAGRGAVVLISGEPGIGKSSLADALARHADAAGARVAVGRCWEAGGAPAFWPWVQALRTILRDSDLDALTDLAGAAERPEAEGARFRMFDAIAALLHRAAADTPVALFLDDLHAADTASLLLLRFVAADLSHAPVAVVGCYRDTEVGPALGEAIAELSREPVVTRVGLKGLDTEAIARLLAATMGAPPPPALVERVQAETRGNPLFAGELGRLFATEGLPDDAAERLPIPDGVREAIHLRLQRQSEACRDLLGLASVVGREFDTRLLARVSDLDAADVGRVLDEATAARLIGEVPRTSGQLRFSHILVRDALYDGLRSTDRMRLHASVAQALAELNAANRAPHLAEIAHHYLEAGPPAASMAIDYARRAANHAESQYGYEHAARQYRNALALLEQAGDTEAATVCDLGLSLGEALSRAGRSSEAKEALRGAAALAEAHGWPDRLARAALAYGGRFAWARGSTDPVLVPLLQRALSAIGDSEPLIRARLLARLAAALRDAPEREARVALAEEAVEIAREADDPVTQAYAVEGYWVATESADKLAEGVVIGDELIALGRRIGDREHEFTGRDFRLNAFWKLADRAGVDVELDLLTGSAEDLRQPAWRWWVRTTRTALTLMEGRLEEAEDLIRETRSFGEQAERWNANVSERLQLFVLRREQGRLAELEDVLARAVHEYPSLMRFGAAQAHLYAELGDAPRARTAFDALLARDLAHEHVDAEWLFTIALLPDPCRFLGDEAAARTLYSLLRPFADSYAHAPVEAAFGSVARSLGVLATVLGRFDDAARHFETATEVERRMRARPWIAHAQHDLAATLILRGGADDRRAAAGLLGEAKTTYNALGMATWAARADDLRRAARI